MDRTFFEIQGWETIEDTAPPTHLHQLKALQDIITRGKAEGQKQKAQLLHRAPSKEDFIQRPYKSLRLNRRVQTETRLKHKEVKQQLDATNWGCFEPYHKSKELDKSKSSKKERAVERKQIKSHSKDESSFVLQLLPKESVLFPKQERFRSTRQMRNGLNASKERLQNRSSKIVMRRNKNELIHSRADNMSRGDQVKKLKSLFMKTLSTSQANHQSRLQHSIERRKRRMMIIKSQKKKKDLEELFKTRKVVGRKQLEHSKIQTNLDHLLHKSPPKEHKKDVKSLTRSEFSDTSMFKPWNFKPEKFKTAVRTKTLE